MTALADTFNALTDTNDHTAATIVLADAIGGALGDAYKVILAEISDRHELAGHISHNDRAMRDAIQKDLLKTCRCMGLI